MSKKNDECKMVLVAQVWKNGKIVSSEELSSSEFSSKEPESMDELMGALTKTETIVADARQALVGYAFNELTSGADDSKKKPQEQ